MAASGFLTKAELRRFTGAAWRSRQRDRLRERGIPFKEEGEDILVLWLHAQAWIEDRAPVSSLVEPDLSAVS